MPLTPKTNYTVDIEADHVYIYRPGTRLMMPDTVDGKKITIHNLSGGEIYVANT